MINLTTKAEIVEAVIRQAGSDHLPTFGGDFEGGYHIQQNPREFAQLVAMLSAYGPFKARLEIGIAAGGATRFIGEKVDVGFTAIIDDGQHPKFPIWTNQNAQTCKPLAQYTGDSHGEGAAEFLRWLDMKFDLVAIDGDHSYEGVTQDWNLVHPYLADGAIVWFHDIVCCDGVRQFWGEIKGRHSSHWEYIDKGHPLGIGVIRI